MRYCLLILSQKETIQEKLKTKFRINPELASLFVWYFLSERIYWTRYANTPTHSVGEFLPRIVWES